MTRSWQPEEIEAFVAGELADENVERVLAAIASDADAAAELEQCMQARAAGHELARQDATRDKLVQVRARPPKRRWVRSVALVLPLAAALALIYLVVRRPRPPVVSIDDRFASALRPHREIEPRLSWSGADRYRTYDPPRAGSGDVEHISFDVLADLEHGANHQALAAAQVLLGNLNEAQRELAQEPSAADVASDRAAVALLQHNPEEAITQTAVALAAAPDHRQALWNRGLAQHALGLDRSAAATFDAIAARSENGWSEEAHRVAAALHEQHARREAAWQHVRAAGAAMVNGGPIPLDQVTAFPGPMRLYFYDAVRAADSTERLHALTPLARALDSHFGGHVLEDYLERIAKQSFARRAQLAPAYAALVRGELDARHAATLVSDLRAARLDDILLGALLQASPSDHVAASDLAEFVALARATNDPWFELFAAEQRGAAALERGDALAAEQILREAAEDCDRKAIAYRCTAIWQRLAETDARLSMPAAATDALARVRATANGVLSFDHDALLALAFAANQRDDVAGSGGAMVTAYLDELDPNEVPCENILLVREAVATTRINQHRLADARAVLAAGPACNTVPLSLHRALVPVELVDHADRAAVATLRAQIVALRDVKSLTPGERALVDHLEGRLLIRDDPEAGRALLRRAIATSSRDSSAVKARAYSVSILVEDAGRRAAWREVLELLAEERGSPLPATCVLGAAEETASVFVARGADGATAGVFLPRAIGEPLGAAHVPANLLAALASCSAIDVFARQPFYGVPTLLPTSVVWRFRAGPPLSPPRTDAAIVVIGNVPTPPDLHLSALSPMSAPSGAVFLEGSAATPAGSLAAMRDAGFIEIHAHGLTDVGDEAAVLALAPDTLGHYALTSTTIAATTLTAHPVVALAACGAAATGHAFHSTWGLVDAFRAAGASAVIASPDPISDAAAPRFFAGVRGRIRAGADPSAALRDERNAWTDPIQRKWIDRVVVFQ